MNDEHKMWFILKYGSLDNALLAWVAVGIPEITEAQAKFLTAYYDERCLGKLLDFKLTIN